MTLAAALAGALGAAAVLLARGRAGLLAGFGMLALGGAALGLGDVPASALGGLLASPVLLAGAVAGLLVLGALAALLVRCPYAIAPLVLIAAPTRLPLEIDTGNTLLVGIAEGGELGRLLPLYGVLAVATLALAWRALRAAPLPALPLPFAIPAALFVALTALSLLWARDPEAARMQLLFFWLPLVLLVAVVARAPFASWLPRLLAVVLVGVGALAAAIGLWQAWNEQIFFYAPKLAEANAYASFFRVTSLFQDPSLYGRQLVLATALVLVGLWLDRLRLAYGVAIVVLLAAGLYFSYSQTSMITLAVVTLAVTAVLGDRRSRQLVVVTAAAAALVGAGLVASSAQGQALWRATSNRSSLVSNTARVFAHHPLLGVGVASQPLATRDEERPGTNLRQNASHTTPLTVAAELGLAGLVAYLALAAGTVWMLLEVRRRDQALGLGLAATLLVLFVHSLSYGEFFEDPIMWGILAVGAGALGGVSTGAPAGMGMGSPGSLGARRPAQGEAGVPL